MMRGRDYVIGSILLLGACAGTLADPIHALIRDRSIKDGTHVQVVGRIGVSHGLISLFSIDRKECIGLLVTEAQRKQLIQLDGNLARVSGILEAEGCGREGICVEHLCGPTVLTNVTVDARQ